MGRMIRNFLLFFFVIAVITGTFFGTRGCGSIEVSKQKLSLINRSNLPLGPILVEKGKELILYPGMSLWRKIDPAQSGWQEKAIQLITDRVENSLDSILYVDQIDRQDIVDYVNQTIGDRLNDFSLQDIASGAQIIDLNLSEFISLNSQYLREELTGRMDSLINQIGLEEVKIPGNF